MKYLIIIGIAMLVSMTIYFIIRRKERLTTPKIGEILPAGEMQKKYGLYAESRPIIKVDYTKVPANLVDLIPMAEKWGIEDNIIRSDFEEKASESEKKEFKQKLTGRTKEVEKWLDSFKNGASIAEEAAHFMYMLEALDEMQLWPDI